jgi:2-polyprenyl-3-methyl-5-hydroxy-6-metoxy-1,4-benzoquinol methylase
LTEPSDTLRREFGDIDIYLFDQLHRGNITIGMRVLDAGFGQGRNLVYLLRQGFDVSGVDMDAAAVDAVRRLARTTHADADARFRDEPVESMSFADASFDVVISSAVLHFAADERQWHRHDAGDVARAGAGGTLFREVGDQRRSRIAGAAARQSPLHHAGRGRTIPCRRVIRPGEHERPWRQARGSDQDQRRARQAFDDDVGDAAALNPCR